MMKVVLIIDNFFVNKNKNNNMTYTTVKKRSVLQVQVEVGT